MKKILNYLLASLITGIVVIIPLYLCLLLLLKAMGSLKGLVRPIAELLPKGLPRENLVALLLIILLCLLVGIIVRTKAGHAFEQRIEGSLFRRIPGYALFRSFTQRFAGITEGSVWQPALAEIEEALVPAFIIEKLDDGRCTVFVPSPPSPLSGSVYILEPSRVHPVDVSFKRAIMIISRWGEGSKELLAIAERNREKIKP